MPQSILLLTLAASTLTSATPAPPTFDAADLNTIRLLPVQYQGRWSPLDTLARDTVLEITGTLHWQRRDPLINLLDWSFRPDLHRREPLVRVPGQEVRRLLGLDTSRDHFSITELREHTGFMQQFRQVMNKQDQDARLDALDEKVEQIANRLATLNNIFTDELIRPIPSPNAPHAPWLSVSALPANAPPEFTRIRQAWQDVGAAFLQGNPDAFRKACDRYRDTLDALTRPLIPNPERIPLEYRYHSLNPFRWAWQTAAIAALATILSVLLRRRVLDVAVGLLTALAFAWVSLGIGWRWQLAGRIPAANMYESMICMGWGLALATLVCCLFMQNRWLNLVASLMTVLALTLADLLPLEHGIRPIAPVLLDTAWMGIHVPVIMVSYSLLTIAMGFALVAMVLSAFFPRQTSLLDSVDHLHYRFIQVGTLLLTAGIVTGSMWGSASWGRYWGWDPKEVWSLVAMLGYIAILHARHARWLRAFGTALCSAAAFWLIVMTYVGVNFVLGIGLHSYAFGKGAVVKWLLTIGCIQLVFIGLIVLVHLFRGGSRSRPASSDLPPLGER